EGVPADHRLHLAGVRIEGDQRALDLRLLVEREPGDAVGALRSVRDGDHVARLEGRRGKPRLAPHEPLGRQDPRLPRRLPPQAPATEAHDDGMDRTIGELDLRLAREEGVDLARLELADRPAKALAAVELAEALAERLLGGALHAQVERGVDPQP